MFEKTSRNLVKGFLRSEGRKVVNEAGEEIVLTGWGLGNWLLPEGYMWLSGTARFDRPRRMEEVIRELAGSDYAESFWTSFRENYVTREDIRMMAELGYNSVRIPIGWRVLMADEPGITWKEEGFALIDRCLDWCEEFGLYAFLDLHGAPGGQTGSNIDDSIDDFPRLFTDEDSWHKCIELWKELARRYRDRWIVGGYDLLNEPLRPGLWEDKHEYYLTQRLVDFYDAVIPEIRAIDSRHMLSIEGHRWATDMSIFYKKYDENMVIHFHRYACMPGMESLREYVAVSERLNQPLWLGETGESYPEWYAALYPLSVSLDIGYNLWPWKKMSCTNSPYSIHKPEGWGAFMEYAKGGARPSYASVQQTLDQFLELMKVENCTHHPVVTSAAFRRPGCRVRATDFDELPGKGESYSGLREEGNIFNYRSQTGMAIRALVNEPESKRFVFDSGWDRLVLEMEQGEFAAYTFSSIGEGSTVSFELVCLEEAVVSVTQDGREIARTALTAQTSQTSVAVELAGTAETAGIAGEEAALTIAAPLAAAEETVVKVNVHSGKVQFQVVHVD
ncbi:glycoside hydrolase [Paenibacillaceae bacterium]|nr:glycoside hydrolase [Paenibacillaceae bacterium]